MLHGLITIHPVYFLLYVKCASQFCVIIYLSSIFYVARVSVFLTSLYLFLSLCVYFAQKTSSDVVDPANLEGVPSTTSSSSPLSTNPKSGRRRKPQSSNLSSKSKSSHGASDESSKKAFHHHRQITVCVLFCALIVLPLCRTNYPCVKISNL